MPPKLGFGGRAHEAGRPATRPRSSCRCRCCRPYHSGMYPLVARPAPRSPRSLEHPLDLVVQTERDAHTTASSGLSISGIADVETTSPIDRACAIVFWSVRR